LVAILPNVLFAEHWMVADAAETDATVATSAGHQHHATGANESASADATPDENSTHCHVGPESCAASSGLSNAIVISAALMLTLLGGGVLLLATKGGHLSLFDLPRRLMIPPRMNLRWV
jgi:hypothetical protein